MRRVLMALGIVVGLVAAVAAMALMNALRRVFVTARDVSVALDLPVLAAVTKGNRDGMLRP
jgi:capsular polysaccharide biosynthesis protein